MRDIAKFPDEVVRRFKTARPTWVPPHATIYKTARAFGLVATINGITEVQWKRSWHKWFEDLDIKDHLKIVVEKPGVRLTKTNFTMIWTDCQKLTSR